MSAFYKRIRLYFDGVFHLFAPDQCVTCDTELALSEKVLCGCCWSELPVTYYEQFKEPSHLDKLFWGRVRLFSSFSLLFYHKQAAVKNLLFDLKYNGRPDIGRKFGRLIGSKLNTMRNFDSVDVILPVPLHPKKMRKRGYNQAKMIADGIAVSIGKPINEGILVRNQHNESQTKMSRFKRWENIKESFDVTALVQCYNHVLIVDDVITTGATLESIIQQIHEKAPYIRISVVSLAIAN